MSENERRFFSGVSLEQALMRAASHYGIDPDEVAYRPVEKRTGFIRKRRGVVIAVDPEQPRIVREQEAAPVPERREAMPEPPPTAHVEAEAPRVEAEPPREVAPERAPVSWEKPRVELEAEAVAEAKPEPEVEVEVEVADTSEAEAEAAPAVEPGRERLPEATGSLALAAERAARMALGFAGMEPRIAVRQGDGRLELELEGEGRERLVAEGGDLLLSLEHLVPRMMRGLVDESTAVRVDCDDFHERRRVRLQEEARRAADQARSQGEEVALEPMAPDARRLVHIALEGDTTVSTRSVGRGLFKRVVIRPAES